jgi:hypothetical protein
MVFLCLDDQPAAAGNKAAVQVEFAAQNTRYDSEENK